MILVITGPTGVGKTKLSIELAKKYKAIIVNADSMQVYKDLNIGTAKITEEEKSGIHHELLDIVNVEDMFTVYDYQKKAREIIEKYKDKNLIFVGGTGLYLKATFYDYKFKKEDNKKDYSNLTNEELLELCLRKDKNCNIHVNNRKRLERFLDREESFNKDKLLYNCTFIGLTTDRKILYERINQRVDKMFLDGLLKEVKDLYDRGIKSKAISTGIGYKELYDYFDGKLTLEEAKELIKKNSRKYAKRQYTWFNNQMNIKWFNVDFANFDNTINEIIEYIGGSYNGNV